METPVSPWHVPEHGVCVALVKSRIRPGESLLDHVLQAEFDPPAAKPEVLTEDTALSIATALVYFQKQNTDPEHHRYSPVRGDALFELQSRICERAEPFMRQYLPFLDSFSRSVCEYLFSYFRDYIATNSVLIGSRNKKGLFIDGHGDLRAGAVLLREGKVQFPNRAPAQYRRGDCLRDLAILCCDLRLNEGSLLAESMEAEYRLLNPDAFHQQHYDFHLSLEAFLRAVEAFSELPDVDSLATRALQVSLNARFSLQGTATRIFVFIGDNDELCESVAVTFSELLGFEFLGRQEVTAGLPLLPSHSLLLEDRLFERLEREIKSGTSLAIATGTVAEQLIHKLRRAAAGSAELVVLRLCDTAAEEGKESNNPDSFLSQSALMLMSQLWEEPGDREPLPKAG